MRQIGGPIRQFPARETSIRRIVKAYRGETSKQIISESTSSSPTSQVPRTVNDRLQVVQSVDSFETAPKIGDTSHRQERAIRIDHKFVQHEHRNNRYVCERDLETSLLHTCLTCLLVCSKKMLKGKCHPSSSVPGSACQIHFLCHDAWIHPGVQVLGCASVKNVKNVFMETVKSKVKRASFLHCKQLKLVMPRADLR